jgi:hypothetical protein
MVIISGDEASPKGLRVYLVGAIELIFEANHCNGPMYGDIPVRNIVLTVNHFLSREPSDGAIGP